MLDMTSYEQLPIETNAQSAGLRSLVAAERADIAAANAANVQFAGQQLRVIIITTRQPTLGPRPGTFLRHFQKGDCSYIMYNVYSLIHSNPYF